MEMKWIVARNISFVFLIFFVLWALCVLMEREWVKEALRAKGCTPIFIRWKYFGKGWWKRFGMPYGSTFQVRYSDLFGNIHDAWCLVPHYRWRAVEWIEEEKKWS